MGVALAWASACTFGSEGASGATASAGSGDGTQTGGTAGGSATTTGADDTAGPIGTGHLSTATSAADTSTPPLPTSTAGDDSGATTATGVDETCNGVDDDGDGAIDEFSPVNDACGPCRYQVGPNVAFVYSFCDDAVSQPAARAHCQELGGDLASIHDAATNEFIHDQIHDRSFIGFNDVETENSFVWTDGTAVDFVEWDFMEPNDADAGQDCAVMRDAQANWDDVSCGLGHFYVCRGPL